MGFSLGAVPPQQGVSWRGASVRRSEEFEIKPSRNPQTLAEYHTFNNKFTVVASQNTVITLWTALQDLNILYYQVR
jgi:hypothetical protein